MADVDSEQVKKRKDEHIDLGIALARNRTSSPFDRFGVRHCALPEVALSQVDLTTYFLGKKIKAPLVIESMTGGTKRGGKINRNLAKAAQICGIPLFLGSGKPALMDESALDTYKVRDLCPGVPLFANIGICDLESIFSLDQCKQLVEDLGADGIVLHLNPLQEALQSEGNTDFRGKLKLIEKAASEFDFPVVVKEVGHGIAPELVQDLSDAGVAAVDIAGVGGISFAAVEGLRVQDPILKKTAQALALFGLETPVILKELMAVPVTVPIIASGGIGNGLDAFKALCLGADWTGAAGALLEPADNSGDQAVTAVQALIKTLRIAMFCVGCKSLEDLKYNLLIEKAHMSAPGVMDIDY